MRRDQSPYSSVMVSQGLRALPHRDGRNEGLNHLLVLGNYVGGNLWVHDEDGPLVMEVQGALVPASDVSGHGSWISFDASRYHEGLHRLAKEDWVQLGLLGFDVPALQRVASEQEAVGEREGQKEAGQERTGDKEMRTGGRA
eukprot:2029852-Amphidinium_carterae.1